MGIISRDEEGRFEPVGQGIFDWKPNEEPLKKENQDYQQDFIEYCTKEGITENPFKEGTINWHRFNSGLFPISRSELIAKQAKLATTQTYYFAVYWEKDQKYPYNTLPNTDLNVIKDSISCTWINVQYFQFEAKLP